MLGEDRGTGVSTSGEQIADEAGVCRLVPVPPPTGDDGGGASGSEIYPSFDPQGGLCTRNLARQPARHMDPTTSVSRDP
jgi:hypothetical protein